MNEATESRSLRNSPSEVRAEPYHAALMIDFDNVTMGIRSDLQNQLRRLLDSDIIKGKVSVQRAYADWRRYPQYIVPLSEASIDLIFAPAFGANKKNATDIRLAIDALELVFTRPEIGTFILLSGDSDFSALVLKLKEYGKYVIGVGIRESSSDILVQNCDQYYSYSELTGLAKEGEVEHLRRDPWELVVEAVQQMQRDNDVMRSDRLKQVMQSIDPNFEEKDAGYNRFGKFVIGAANRGLLTLTKMENGQFAIELGSNANVLPTDQTTEVEEVAKPRAERARRRPSPGRRGERAKASEALTLSEGFELLKQALLILGAVDSEWTDSERARAQMVELYGEESDPVFASRRFERLLRQARDANLIEMTKTESGGYALRLDPAALLDDEATKQDGSPTIETAIPAKIEVASSAQPRRRKASKPPRGRSATPPEPPSQTGEPEVEEPKKTRQTRRAPRPQKAPGPQKTQETPPAQRSRSAPRTARTAKTPSVTNALESQPQPPVREKRVSQSEERRNPRFRRGSRGAVEQPAPTATADDKPRSAHSPAVPTRPSTGVRSLGVRKGSRGGSPSPRPPDAHSNVSGESSKPAPSTGQRESPDRKPPREQIAPRDPATRSQASKEVPEASESDSGGLLRRMSTAFQRAVRGKTPKGDEPPGE